MSFPGTSGPLCRRMFFPDSNQLVYCDYPHMCATTDSVARRHCSQGKSLRKEQTRGSCCSVHVSFTCVLPGLPLT